MHMVYLHGYDAPRLGQLSNFSVKLRLSSSVQTHVLGAQKNRIIETVVLSTHNIFFCCELGKIIFCYALLSVGLANYSTDLYKPCFTNIVIGSLGD